MGRSGLTGPRLGPGQTACVPFDDSFLGGILPGGGKNEFAFSNSTNYYPGLDYSDDNRERLYVMGGAIGLLEVGVAKDLWEGRETLVAIRTWRRFCFFGALAVLPLLASACAGTKQIKTDTIHFRCDSDFNEGLMLPVDLVYVSDPETMGTITAISPDEWFDSPTREQWPHKQSMSLSSSNIRKTVDVRLEKPKKAVAIVIVADYRSIVVPQTQQVILEAKKAEEDEDVFVTINGLLH